MESREENVRTFSTLFRQHFRVLTEFARRCAFAVTEDEFAFMSAVGHLALIAVRLHDLECTWQSVRVGVADLIPALDAEETELRDAASALGSFTHGAQESVAEQDRLIGVLLQATGPFSGWDNALG